MKRVVQKYSHGKEKGAVIESDSQKGAPDTTHLLSFGLIPTTFCCSYRHADIDVDPTM
jgi:hypothetical protein